MSSSAHPSSSFIIEGVARGANAAGARPTLSAATGLTTTSKVLPIIASQVAGGRSQSTAMRPTRCRLHKEGSLVICVLRMKRPKSICTLCMHAQLSHTQQPPTARAHSHMALERARRVCIAGPARAATRRLHHHRQHPRHMPLLTAFAAAPQGLLSVRIQQPPRDRGRFRPRRSA